MDEAKAHAIPFEELLRTPLCKCMREKCSNLHYADLSDEQQNRLKEFWES